MLGIFRQPAIARTQPAPPEPWRLGPHLVSASKRTCRVYCPSAGPHVAPLTTKRSLPASQQNVSQAVLPQVYGALLADFPLSSAIHLMSKERQPQASGASQETF